MLLHGENGERAKIKIINLSISMNKILLQDLQEIKRSANHSLDLLSGKKILITGGGGFLGYELIHMLSEIGVDDGRSPAEIYLYDNFIRGKKSGLLILKQKEK